eukprot:gnl/MRDRNA2_/MRDRNA2_48531_c0_seq1.p1 gnl/MRDRNA2_/MRDRNA2_48531_c0~~gnl/MRDRNA2_/MRDRNA2_48531_c0_seq1.p1  ORF type:complete len:265 (-),score=17.69 gnl/MRDRNA2_/MRDRNA2_48531_c0_seq1:13-807(-)
MVVQGISHTHLRTCLFVCTCVAVGTLLLCYFIWLNQGCLPFFPFISDFAVGQSSIVFPVGLILVALILSPVCYGLHIALKQNIEYVRPCTECLCKSLVVLVIICNFGIISVALNPWNERLLPHIVGAYCVFYGGILFGGVAALLKQRRNLPFKRPLIMSCLAFFTELLMEFCTWKGMVTSGASTSRAQWDELQFNMTLMGHDYLAYCSGEAGTFHSFWWINVGALCECLLIGLVIFILYTEIDSEFQVLHLPVSISASNRLLAP